ncbi:unnamed protein product [Penicillium camemberti]|uniref:Str. FM013 n=1 Tax=Penicillium camemberti (strain FM 013) TaxID=1429867 RepID=A0A0G4NWU5_PENC3|nr:unnamed protein product [Penicillium camemberti]
MAVYLLFQLDVYCTVHEAPKGLPEAASMVRCRITSTPLSSFSSLYRNVEPGAERHSNCGIGWICRGGQFLRDMQFGVFLMLYMLYCFPMKPGTP